MPGITQIVWVPTLGATPAKVNRQTGVMYLSRAAMQNLPPEYRLFIMLHEMAHVVLQTTDEVAADNWAFNQYAAMGYSLKAGVKALTRVLNDKDPEHAWRMYSQLKRAEKFDYEVNNNKNAYDGR